MNLRPYQKKAVAAVRKQLRAGQRTVLVTPTGSGKTVMGACLALRLPRPVLWVVHRRELMLQAQEHLTACGCDAALYAPGVAVDVEIASAGVAARSRRRYASIVIDECHRAAAASYTRLLEQNPAARVLGLTATPWRLDGKPLKGIFTRLVTAAAFSELAQQGHLAVPVTYGIPETQAREVVHGVPVAVGDYTLPKLNEAMLRPRILGDVVTERERLGGDRKSLVFAVSTEHAEALAQRFQAAGRSAEVLSYSLSTRKRESILERFRHGDLQIIVNVDLLTEGFDMAAVQCVSLARPTQSLTRYLQYVGRALRPWGCDAPVIIDHVGNVWRHGVPEADREWTLEGRQRLHLGVDHISRGEVWRCSGCGSMHTFGVKTCPACGPRLEDARTREAREVQLERVRSPFPSCARCGAPCLYSGAKRSKRAHCSTECRLADSEALLSTCEQCGKQYKATDRRSALKRKYCSEQCHRAARPLRAGTCPVCAGPLPRYGVKYCGDACRSLDVSRKQSETSTPICATCGVVLVLKHRFQAKKRKYCGRECAHIGTGAKLKAWRGIR